MSLHHFVREQIILPLSDLVNHQHVYRYLQMLRQAESWNEQTIQAFQEQRFRELVRYVSCKVPYYVEWFKKSGNSPDAVTLGELPILSKAFMREQGVDRFEAKSFPNNKKMYSRSSGSTGEPFSFYVSKESYSMNLAAKLHTWYRAGYRLGDPYMKIANGARHGRMKTLQDKVNRCIYVPLYAIDDAALKSILDQMEKQRPAFVRSYPVPLYLLAQYRNSHSNYQFHPRRIFTTGSTLPWEYRKVIESAFGCDVIDSYSCEGTPNTFETPAHDGYHITNTYGIVEVLDEQDQPVTNGIGRVVSTDLWNYAFPFLRYDTQDLVEMKNGQIIRIMGRECESLIDVNGQRFTVHNFVGFFQEEDRPIRKSVEAYQVVKCKDGSILFRLKVNDQYTEAMEQYIVSYWQQQLHVPVKVALVDEILMMKNNKRLTIVEEP